MKKEKIGLSSSQKKAVEFSNGSMLVVAGAGTGKTRVITSRIKFLLEKKQIQPKEILALTFTDKAATEMLERVDDVMPLGYEEPWIQTFHSFADRILREEGLEIGLDPTFKLMSSSVQWMFFRKYLFEFDLKYFRPLGNPTKFISEILKFISRLQDEYISPSQFSEFANSFEGDFEEKTRWLELANVYEKYTQLKIQHSKMDFGDLISWNLKLFKQRSHILEKYKKLFKHVLVDEFQDTNYAQYELIKLLCPADQLTERSLLVVGDDSQSIYKFRGAAVSNILQFMEDYKDSSSVTLVENYRSTQPILDASYKLIQNNNPDTLESKLGIKKELQSMKDEKNYSMPSALVFSNLEAEAEFISKRILELLGEEPIYSFKDFAVLARANNHLDPFVMSFRKHGIPYQLVGNRGLYDRDEVRNIIAFLKVLVNPRDSISLYRVLSIESLDISAILISNFLSLAKQQKVDLWEVVNGFQVPEVENLVNVISTFSARISDVLPSQLVYELMSSIKYIQVFVEEDTIENELCVQNINKFYERIKSFELEFKSDTKEFPTVVDFVAYLELAIEAGENPAQAEVEDFETVKLMTVHASKGLEFPVVFITNAVADRFPTRNRSEVIKLPDELIKEILPSGDAHIQEERRLFYVGMTRAQKYLYLTLSKSYGGTREKRPSGFVLETGIALNEVPEIESKKNELSLFGVESGFREMKANKIRENFAPDFLSYSQISTFENCGLQYKYKYVINVPTSPSHALTFGNSIHATLKDFHTRKMFEEVSLEQLYEIFDKNWDPLGYLDENHRNMRYQSGKELLKNYYEINKDSKSKPVALEKSFNFRINGIKFFGKIDRIDPLDEGGVEIIDYKTGTIKDQTEIDKDDQISYYAIAAKESLGLEPKKLTYYYLEDNKKLTTFRTPEQLFYAKEKAISVIKDITDGKFIAKPGPLCSYCDFKEFCPYASKG